MKNSQTIFISDPHAQGFSRLDQKLLEKVATRDPFVNQWVMPVDAAYTNYFLQRMKERDLFWCPDHNAWEGRYENPCHPEFDPAELTDDMPEPNEGDGEEGPGIESKGEGEQEGEGGDGQQGEGEGKSLVGRELEGTGDFEYTLKGQKIRSEQSTPNYPKNVGGKGIETQNYKLDVMPDGTVNGPSGTEWGKLKPQEKPRGEKGEKDYSQDKNAEGKQVEFKSNSPYKNTLKTEVKSQEGKQATIESKTGATEKQFEVKPDGSLWNSGKEHGAIKGSKADKRQQQEKPKPKRVEKWSKIILNRCPLCTTEGQSYKNIEGKKPSDPMEHLDYTEDNCGCEALKKMFQEIDQRVPEQPRKSKFIEELDFR
jgi:hypothetical protein